MKDIKYKQCILNKGNITQTSWIPEKFAVIGKFLRLENDNGWEVKAVSSIALNEETVNSNSRDYKRTRKASDI